MKSINEIHAELVLKHDMYSWDACELIGGWCGRTGWAVYKWLKNPPNEITVDFVSRKYSDYMEKIK